MLDLSHGHLESWVVRPPIHNVDTSALPDSFKEVGKWGWVRNGDLGECVHALFKRKGVVWPVFGGKPGVVCNNSVFEHFGDIEHEKGTRVFTWCNMFAVSLRDKPPFGPQWDDFMVPALFSNRVLNLVDQGIVRVEVRRARNVALPVHELVGFTADGTLMDVLPQGERESTYRVEPYNQV